MRFLFLFVLLCLSLTTFSQPVVYQPFEVDTVAEPRGGIQAIDAYIQTSMRKPTGALAQGLTGRVIVKGIAEPNGYVSDVRILRGLRADCDSEAVRVFTTFNAWKPALKNGKPVRQHITYPVEFRANRPFIYQNGARITYLDRNMIPVSDTLQKARYKLIVPIQSNWLPSGDIVLYKSKGATAWQEATRYKLVREQLPQKTASDKRISRLSYRTPANTLYDNAYEVDEDGIMLSSTTYDQKGRPSETFRYAPNGALVERTRHEMPTLLLNNDLTAGSRLLVIDSRALTAGSKKVVLTHQTTWFPTGQIRQIRSIESPGQLERIYFVCDSTGVVLVDKGNGMAVFQEPVQCESDTTRQTVFVETGRIASSLKQGIWTGHYADESYFYEEQYAKGVFQGGRAGAANLDTIRYTVREVQPEFEGGMQGIDQFLAQNLRYPADAQRARVQGQVLVRFVVNTDGSLSDYEIIKSIDSRVDDEALQVVKAMSGKWKPGYLRGKAIRMPYNLPVNFRLR